MNIKEANDNLIMLKYFLQEEGDEYGEKYCEAIETLLTAYEKEKEKNEFIIEGMKEVRRVTVEEIKEQFYVSKEKIKERIEEIRKEHSFEDDYAESQIYILQSLLEKE